jgi:HD-like signal output (HDOD) protein
MARPHLSIVSKTEGSFEAALTNGELYLPLLPRVSSMVIQLSTNEDANAQQRVQLIQSDPALAGHVLRLANSPIYRGASLFVSLQQATAWLGMSSICEIERLRTNNVEASFLAGLLCCIGRPIVLQGVCELGLKPAAIETFVADYDVRAGLSICHSPALPRAVSTAIEHHQAPDYSGAERDSVVNVQAALDIVRAAAEENAGAMADKEAHKKTDKKTGPEALSTKRLVQLNFYPEDIQALTEKSAVIDSWLETVGG